MRVTRYDNVSDFYTRALPLWMRNEAAECLSIGITNALIEQWDRYGDDPYLATVEDENGEIVLVAIRTPPRDLILSLTDRLDALDPLVEHFHYTYGTLPGVQAEVEIGRQFCERWTALTKTRYRINIPERIFQLETVETVSGVSGYGRRATPADRDQVVDWVIAFEAEAFNTPPQVDRAARERWFDAGLDTPSRGIYVWDDGGIVSFVGHQGPTPNGMRIGPVYTPPDKRGRGYASALTAYVSQTLLDSGRKFCFLYTDLRNPTSNKIYQQIGYKPVIDHTAYIFTE